MTFLLYQLLIFLNLFIIYLFRQRDFKKKVSTSGQLVTIFHFTQPADRKRTTFQGWPYDIINCLNKNLITHFFLYLGKEKRYGIETVSIDRVLNKEHFYGKIMQEMCTKS